MDAFQMLIIVLGIIAIVVSVTLGDMPQQYRQRSCAENEWKKLFPNTKKELIREYLECFVYGMAFNSKERLKFKPSDEILVVYQSIYGGKTPLGDAMELETFSLCLKESFGISFESLEAIWHEHLTLGDLFSHILAQQGTPADPKTALRF